MWVKENKSEFRNSGRDSSIVAFFVDIFNAYWNNFKNQRKNAFLIFILWTFFSELEYLTTKLKLYQEKIENSKTGEFDKMILLYISAYLLPTGI